MALCHCTLRNHVHFKYISLTTVVQPGYCNLKSEVAALNLCWCCHVMFWSVAPPSTDLPISSQ